MKPLFIKAFSLAEILIVLAIFGALSAVIIATINPNARLATGRNAVRLNDLTVIQAAVERFVNNAGVWPAGLATEYKAICKGGVASSVCLSSGLVDLSELSFNQKYLASIPSDPSNSSALSSGYEIAKTAGGNILVRAPLAELNVSISTTNGGSCEPQCSGKNCGDDGCGGSCGTCAVGLFCSNSGSCTTTPTCLYEGDTNFCSRLNKDCQFSGLDNCNVYKTVNCGTCVSPQTCGGSGTAGLCGCTPNCSIKNCGDDGCGGSCGTCCNGLTCNSSGYCVPSTQECTASMPYGTTCGGGILICKRGNGNCNVNLVVAPAGCIINFCSSQDSIKYKWENPNDYVSEAGVYVAGSSIVGFRNLNGNTYPTIANYNPASKYQAAAFCASLSLGGFTDWYLPANYEVCTIRLSSAYCDSGVACYYGSRLTSKDCMNGSTPTNPLVPDIVSGGYWSSTQHTATNAYIQNMSDGSQSGYNKSSSYFTRCVRQF